MSRKKQIKLREGQQVVPFRYVLHLRDFRTSVELAVGTNDIDSFQVDVMQILEDFKKGVQRKEMEYDAMLSIKGADDGTTEAKS